MQEYTIDIEAYHADGYNYTTFEYSVKAYNRAQAIVKANELHRNRFNSGRHW